MKATIQKAKVLRKLLHQIPEASGCEVETKKALIDFLLTGDAETCMAQLYAVADHYPPHALHACMNHLGTHDTERILTVLGGEETGDKKNAELAVLRMTPEERTRQAVRDALGTMARKLQTEEMKDLPRRKAQETARLQGVSADLQAAKAAKDQAEAFLMLETDRAQAYALDDVQLAVAIARSKAPGRTKSGSSSTTR